MTSNDFISKSFHILAEHSPFLVLLLDDKFTICELNSVANNLIFNEKDMGIGHSFFKHFQAMTFSFPTKSHPIKNFSSKYSINNTVMLISWQSTAIISNGKLGGYLLIGKPDCFIDDKESIKNSALNNAVSKSDAEYIKILEEKINYLENLIEALPGAIYWKDINGIYVGSNYINAFNAGCKSAKEIIGKTDYDLAWKEQADKICAVDKKVMITGKPYVAKEYGKLSSGKAALFLSHKVPIRNRAGSIVGMLGVSIDVSKFAKIIANLEQQTKQAKADAIESQIYLENLIAAMPGHVYWKDINGVYLGSNDRNAQIAGLARGKDLIGKTDFELPWKEHASKLREADIQVMKTGKPIITEESGYIADNIFITVLSHKSPLYDLKKNIIGTVGTSLDITELKRIQLALNEAKEKAEVANQAKSEFIANMSHDIRTPFNGILSLMHFLSMQEQDPEKKEYMTLVVNTAQALLNFLNEVLEMTEIESGSYPITIAQFSLQALIQDIITMMHASIHQKGLELIYNYSDALPINFLGDRLRIHRILLNIVSNSLKFTSSGSIKIAASIEDLTSDSITVKLSVADTGIGIPEDKFEAIFEKFTRLELAHQGIYNGTGLGLGIVKQYLTDIGGSIKVESKLEEGSTFTCYIPLRIAAEQQAG